MSRPVRPILMQIEEFVVGGEYQLAASATPQNPRGSIYRLEKIELRDGYRVGTFVRTFPEHSESDPALPFSEQLRFTVVHMVPVARAKAYVSPKSVLKAVSA